MNEALLIDRIARLESLLEDVLECFDAEPGDIGYTMEDHNEEIVTVGIELQDVLEAITEELNDAEDPTYVR